MKPDPVRAPASREPERDNASLRPARTSVRAPMRPRAAVFQRLTGSEPGRPFRGRRGRALEPLRGSTDRPSFLNDQSRETESSERGQWGVSVSHEDLLAEMVCGNPHPPGGLPFSAQPFTTCRGTTASCRVEVVECAPQARVSRPPASALPHRVTSIRPCGPTRPAQCRGLVTTHRAHSNSSVVRSLDQLSWWRASGSAKVLPRGSRGRRFR